MKSPLKPESVNSPVIATVMILGAVATLYFLRDVLIPLAFAMTFTVLLAPTVTFLEKLRLGRVPSVLLTVLLAIAMTAWSGLVIGSQLVEVINRFPTYRDKVHAKVQALSRNQDGPLSRAAENLRELGQEFSSDDSTSTPAQPGKGEKAASGRAASVPVRVIPTSSNGVNELRELSRSFLGPAAIAGMIVIFTIFMLVAREDLRNRILRLGGLTQLSLMTQAIDDAANRVNRYVLMQFLVNAAFGVIIGTALYFIGVPNAGLWDVVAGILRIVPYLGTLIAAAAPLFLSVAVFDSYLQPLLVFSLFAVVELVVANFFEPWLYGTHTGISSLALLVTTVFWTIIWGPAGLVLSTPLTVCVVVLGRYVPQLSFFHILLGDQPALATEAHLYQRLLAMDQQEARALVDVSVKSRPLIELYDGLLIPALGMAEQDRHRGAIDIDREEFLLLSLNEIVAEFESFVPEAPATDVVERGEALAEVLKAKRKVFCVAAHDEADELVATMLAQVLGHEGYETVALPHDSSPADATPMAPTDLVCISALPPYAFAPTRAVYKALRARFPKTTIVVCIWGFAGDVNKAKARFERPQPQYLVNSLCGAVELLRTLDKGEVRDQESAPLAEQAV